MLPRASLAVVITVAAAGWPAYVAGQVPVERHRLRGERVAVHNIAGPVTVARAEGPDVTVEVRPMGDDRGRLRVASDVIEGVETLRVLYPDAAEVVYAEEGRLISGVGVAGDGRLAHGGVTSVRQVILQDSGTGMRAWAELVVRVPPGKTVEVHVGVGSAEVEDVDGNLTVWTQLGGMSARSVRGELRLRTGVGDVTVSDFRGDELALRAGVGDLVGQDVHARRLEFETGPGNVRMERLFTAGGRIEADPGRVHLDLMTDIEDLEIRGLGSVTLVVPEDFGARMEVRMKGDSRIDLAEHSLDTVLGDGRGVLRISGGLDDVRVVPRQR